MCGFAGYYAPEGTSPPSRERLSRALRTLAHRGPDGEGVHISGDGRVGLAHRRLAVIDLEGGAQPMVDTETGCVVVTNGEIYNFRELLREFEAEGRTTRTRSDTEA
ncbi:MAG: class II glutamine amidotransferase domain-containing protein, partial [Planctomycetota bacterium]